MSSPSPPSTRSSSPGSIVTSSPSSRYSDLSTPESATTSHTGDLGEPSPQHLLVISPSCTSSTTLNAFLCSLPLSKDANPKQYLLLALDHGDEATKKNDGHKTLAEACCTLGAILGDEAMFDQWYQTTSEVISIDGDTPVYFKSVLNEKDVQEVPSCDIDDRFASKAGIKIIHNEALNVFASSGLHLVYRIALSSTSQSSLYLLERAPFSFPSLKPLSRSLPGSDVASKVNPFGPPTREEWQKMWAAWDFVTLRMIPPTMLHQKPIDLRHKCLFYIGHIPTFLNILLSHLFKEPYTEPKNFTQIFERGIDPHVDDPDHCHSHSEVPEADEDWPTLPSILAYRDRVRARLMGLYDNIESGRMSINRRIARVLQMILEHEGFHIETLLYMLIQRAGSGTLPPPGFTSPPWATLAKQWTITPAPSAPAVVLGPVRLAMGHDDAEPDDLTPGLADDVAEHAFGWDNESPRREVDVARFKIDWRPVTNGEFYMFWKSQEGAEGDVGFPASWTESDGQISVRTVNGPVPLAIAERWPVLASYDQLQTYARAKGGRIPSEPELRLFLDRYGDGFDNGANTGFRNWHPVPATTGCEGTNGVGSNGGVWEWTSTPFDGHAGFAPTSIFPGYSSDFFDGKHRVVLGASYATIPRLAGRRTVRNFYQHNYPYAWVSARVAYDF